MGRSGGISDICTDGHLQRINCGQIIRVAPMNYDFNYSDSEFFKNITGRLDIPKYGTHSIIKVHSENGK